MIAKTGMVDSFNVSLSSSFIRPKRALFFLMELELSSLLSDEARTERNVETVYYY